MVPTEEPTITFDLSKTDWRLYLSGQRVRMKDESQFERCFTGSHKLTGQFHSCSVNFPSVWIHSSISSIVLRENCLSLCVRVPTERRTQNQFIALNSRQVNQQTQLLNPHLSPFILKSLNFDNCCFYDWKRQRTRAKLWLNICERWNWVQATKLWRIAFLLSLLLLFSAWRMLTAERTGGKVYAAIFLKFRELKFTSK